MSNPTNNWFQQLNEERYGHLNEASVDDFGLPPEIIEGIRHELGNAGNKAQIWIGEQWKQQSSVDAHFNDKASERYFEYVLAPTSDLNKENPAAARKLQFILENILKAIADDSPGANGRIHKALVKARKGLSKNELLKKVYGEKLEEKLTELFEMTYDEHNDTVSGIRQFALRYNWIDFSDQWTNVLTFLDMDPTNYAYFKGKDLEDEVEEEYYDRQSRSEETLNFENAEGYAEYMLSNAEDEANIVHRFPDGPFWYNLKSTSCSIEAERMGHCGSSGTDGTLYSLRYIPKNQKWSSSLVTVDLDENGRIGQIKGRENEAPPKETWDNIVWFIDNMKVKEVSEDGAHSSDVEGINDMMEYLSENTDIDYIGSIETQMDELSDGLDAISNEYNPLYTNQIEVWAGNVDEIDDGEIRFSANAGYIIHIPLGWEGAVKKQGGSWTSSNEEERSKLKTIPQHMGYQNELSDIFSSLTDDFGESALNDYEIVTHTGEPILRMDYVIDCQECYDKDDYENFASWLQTDIDLNHDKLVKNMQKILANHGYIFGSKWRENSARIHTDYLQDLEHFSPWGDPEEGATELAYATKWIPAGFEVPGGFVESIKRTMAEYDLVAVLKTMLGGRFVGRRGLSNGWLVLPTEMQKKIQAQIQSLYSASKQMDKRQPTLPGIPQHYLRSTHAPLPLAGNMTIEAKMIPANSTSNKPNFDYSRPAFVYYRVKYVFTEDDNEQELFAAAKALRLLDKNPRVFDIAKEAISGVMAEKTKHVVGLYTKSKDQLLDGTIAKRLAGSVIDTYSRRDDHPARMRVAATRWIIDNFDKMNNAEKTVAVKDYLAPMNNGGHADYDIEDGGPPGMWAPRVRTAMEKTGETGDVLSESVENQITRVSNMLDEKEYDLRIYSVRILCGIHNDAGGTAEQTENEIRGISGVTIVAPVTDKKSNITPTSYVVPYNIKFELDGQGNRKSYVHELLIPGMREIEGLSVVKILGAINRIDSKTTAISESKIMKEFYGNSATGFGGVAGNLGALRKNFGREMETPRPSLQDIIDDWAEGGVQLYDAPSDTTDMRYHVMMPVEELWTLCNRYYRGGKADFDSRYRDFIRDGAKAPVYLSIGKNGRAKITGNEDIVWFAKRSGLEEVPVFLGYQRQV